MNLLQTHYVRSPITTWLSLPDTTRGSTRTSVRASSIMWFATAQAGFHHDGEVMAQSEAHQT